MTSFNAVHGIIRLLQACFDLKIVLELYAKASIILYLPVDFRSMFQYVIPPRPQDVTYLNQS